MKNCELVEDYECGSDKHCEICQCGVCNKKDG